MGRLDVDKMLSEMTTDVFNEWLDADSSGLDDSGWRQTFYMVAELRNAVRVLSRVMGGDAGESVDTVGYIPDAYIPDEQDEQDDQMETLRAEMERRYGAK